MITLHHGLASTCSKKVRLALFEKGLEFESRLVNLQKFEQHDPDYLKLNPNGVVPTLVHDGRPVIESTIILEYIEETWPDPPLAPRDPYERARMRLWTRFSDEKAYSAVYVPTWDRLSRPVASRLGDDELEEMLSRIPTAERRARWRATARQGFAEEEFAAARAMMVETYARMDAALEAGGPWLIGGTYSLADIAMVPFVERIDDLAPELFAKGAYPALAEWFSRMQDRPAYDAAFFFDGKDARIAAVRKALGVD